MDEQTVTDGTNGGVTRRTVLATTTAIGLGAAAGCLGDEEDVPDAIAIEDGRDCDNCTMGIAQRPGPVGQSHYENAEELLGVDRPAQFCSSLCTYAFDFEHEDDEPAVSYLTDYSSVDYELEGEDPPEISAHLEARAFARLEGLTLVVDGEVDGAMGASMIGFGDADEAGQFQADHGGDLYDPDDVTADLVMSLM